MGWALVALWLATGVLAQQADPRQVVIGTSAEGRPIDGYWLGNGPDPVIIVGGIHGGPELNSSDLVWQLLDFFAGNQRSLPPDVGLLFVPDANPDGLANGTRELADGVDPNRNFPTGDWTQGTYGPYGWLPQGGGRWPLSELETVALAQMVERIHPVAVLSYHSAAGFAMGGASSERTGLLETYADTTGYPAQQFMAYPVTGDFAQWCDEIGIPTVEVELTDHFDPEVDRNLAGVEAVLQRVSAGLISTAADRPY